MQFKSLFAASFVIITSLSLSACTQPKAEVVDAVATTWIEQPADVISIESAPTDTPEMIETITPEPVIESDFHAPDPETWTFANWADIDTLDPAWNYESDGDGILEDIYDALVTYAGADASQVIPKLAIWEVLDEGKTYVFTLRQGVKFHEGQDLSAEDVAYSFQRGLLQGGSFSPQWLFTEAFFGSGIYDVTCLMDGNQCALLDDPQALQAADPDRLLEVCQQVTNAIVADDSAGTVTFYLAQPWAPLLSALAGSWGSIIDKDWAIEQGAWDGDCTTWQDYYGVTSENAPLRAIANGTGPYMLDHWTPGEEIVLVANEDYWLTEPLWEGAPSGPARLKRVVIKVTGEFGPRFAMLQAGEADKVWVQRDVRTQVDSLVGEVCIFQDWSVYNCQPSEHPEQPLRLYKGTPSTSRTDILFNFQINAEGSNPYLGSGNLDGNGIPPDFFSDVHVRKAFNYCFDWDTLIAETWEGQAVQNYGPIQVGLIGYDENAPHYSFDLQMCQAEIEQAWDGALAEKGFRFQFVYANRASFQQIIARILQSNFAAIDPKYKIETIGLPWSNYLSERLASRLPLITAGWSEDIHDPHAWVQPFLVGHYATLQGLPQELTDEFQALIDAGVTGQTVEQRAAVYGEIQRLDYEYAPALRLVVGSDDHYVQRWVSDYLINPMLREPFYLWAKE